MYFAYGRNMDSETIRDRCPTATVVCPGRLLDHQFIIIHRGVASVTPVPGATVHGVVMMISAADEAALDRYEGVEGGYYRKVIKPIVCAADRADKALIYVATSTRPGHPRQGYLEDVIRGAKVSGLPGDYLDELMAWSLKR